MRVSSCQKFLAFSLLMLSCIGSAEADWPMYRADARRSGITSEPLASELTQLWEYQPAQKPQPAWPDPVKERHRIDFDHAPQPVVAKGIVYFGSSADDTIRAIDAKTGKLLWKKTTGGPIRFAPAVDRGKVYVASDDGWLYCLDAKSGKSIWNFHAAERHSRVLGNGRLISRWPLRSGVLVDSGTAYLTAGMWPAEGVTIFALNAETGKIEWCNDTSDSLFLPQPHANAYSLTGVSPQGYLLASPELLLVPTGRGVPAAFDRKTGKLRWFKPSESKTHGGSWATLNKTRMFNGGLVYDLPSGNQIPGPEKNIPYWAVRDFDFGTRNHVLGYRGTRIIAKNDEVIGRRTGFCLALAGDVLIEGGEKSVKAFDATSKNAQTVLWQAELNGQVRGLAVSDGKVFASTNLGTIHCFAEGDRPTHAVVRENQTDKTAKDASTSAVNTIVGLVDQAEITLGYALIVGDADLQLAEQIATRTRLHVVQLVAEEKVEPLRKQAINSGIYGSRWTIQSIRRLAAGNLPAYFANLIVVGGDTESLNGEAIWRVLRPCGGLLCFNDLNKESIDQLIAQAEEPPFKNGVAEQISWYRRGKLTEAFDWDSETPVDLRVKWPLALTWYGGPGPARMQDRHRAWIAPPVTANGRYFVAGENHVIAVDAYNGTELWSWQFATDVDANGEKVDPRKKMRPTGLSADDFNVYIQIKDVWNRLDAQTGKETGELKELPSGLGEWGRIPKRENTRLLPLRTHSLTGETVPRLYYRAYGCNQLLTSEGVDFFRSGSLGFYDVEDDSGLRNFGGFRPGCWRSHNAALGIFISSEGSSGCKCTYNFQTSLALAPSNQQRHEDWAVYYDLPTNGLIRQATINLGAPGDRRDVKKKLWLAYPRPQQPIKFDIPVTVEFAEGADLGPYHFDSDRRTVKKTETPWIYGSGYRGVRRIEVLLDQHQPVISRSAKAVPKIDGVWSESEWDGESQVALQPVENRQNRGTPNRQLIKPEDWKSDLFYSHDETNLYVGFRLPNKIDRKGQPYQWRTTRTGENAPVWIDDSIELFFSDDKRESVIHLGVSAGGARYDARANPQGDEREDTRWKGNWTSAVTADEKAFVAEVQIPWSMLSKAGLSKDRLMVNAQMNWAFWRSPMRFLGSMGRTKCENFTPLGFDSKPAPRPRTFRVQLHFAEPDDVVVGARVFDVKLQGKTVLADFDILKTSGAHATAVVSQFEEVNATDKILIELVPKGTEFDARSETILSGFHLEEIVR